MFAYYALFEADRQHGGFIVTFPDLNHGATQGDTLEEALGMGEDLPEPRQELPRDLVACSAIREG